jgi:hypothetical protein
MMCFVHSCFIENPPINLEVKPLISDVVLSQLVPELD